VIAARFQVGEQEKVRCLLCPHRCLLADGALGRCLARRNRKGTLIAESYGQLTSLALDPIEKKPLYHFHPGSSILSAGSYGCNLSCAFCQNYAISRQKIASRFVPPQELAAMSREAGKENIGVAFTYNEPLIAPEYLLDCADLLHRQHQKVVLVTNGFLNPAPLEEVLPAVDALNIDLKCFSQEGYRKLGGELEMVQNTIRRSVEAGRHVEVTCLIVPGLSDNPEEMEQMAAWLAGVSPSLPFHVSRFFPRYQMLDALPTPVETVYALADVARAYLRHVYTGNC
jgi:pyruvate formate lyase activating enzyme